MFPSLPSLPSLVGFLPGTGGGSGGGIGIPSPGGGIGINIGLPPIQIGGSGGGIQKAGVLGNVGGFFGDLLSGAGSQLLRLVLLLLGLICIIGAIYLYKPTSFVVSTPLRAAAKAGKEAALAAAEG